MIALMPLRDNAGHTYTATLPRASCGSATTHRLAGNTRILRADRGALPCFDAAVRACRSASIEVVQMGASTRTDYLFTVEPGGTGCLVRRPPAPHSPADLHLAWAAARAFRLTPR